MLKEEIIKDIEYLNYCLNKEKNKVFGEIYFKEDFKKWVYCFNDFGDLNIFNSKEDAIKHLTIEKNNISNNILRIEKDLIALNNKLNIVDIAINYFKPLKPITLGKILNMLFLEEKKGKTLRFEFNGLTFKNQFDILKYAIENKQKPVLSPIIIKNLKEGLIC